MKLVISVEGGIVQTISGDEDAVYQAEIVVVDYDLDGVPDEEVVTWDTDYGKVRARAFGFVVEGDPEWVEKAFALTEEQEGDISED